MKIIGSQWFLRILAFGIIAGHAISCMQLDTVGDPVSSTSSISSSSNIYVSSSSVSSSSVSSSSVSSSSVSSSSISSSGSEMQIKTQMQPRLDTTGISYYEAILICNKMSLRDNMDTLYQYDEIKLSEDNPELFWLPNIKVLKDKSGYRLPTREEWELAKANGEINDDDERIGEWIYKDANSEYASFDLAPLFLQAVGLNKSSTTEGYLIYGMRVLKLSY